MISRDRTERVCRNCGLLTHWRGTGQFAQVLWPDRESGGNGVRRNFMCLVGQADLAAEFQQKHGVQKWAAAEAGTADLFVQWLDVLAQDRTACPDFVGYQQGRTPREHLDMVERRRLIEWQEEQRKEQRAWEQARFEEIKEREDDRDAEMRRREDDRDDAARSRHWQSMLVLGGAVAVATIVAAIINAVTQRQGDNVTNVYLPTSTVAAPTLTPTPDVSTPQPSPAE